MLALGVLTGHLLGRRIPVRWSRPIVLGISGLGGAVTVLHALVG